jgi:hypothetical protein
LTDGKGDGPCKRVRWNGSFVEFAHVCCDIWLGDAIGQFRSEKR